MTARAHLIRSAVERLEHQRAYLTKSGERADLVIIRMETALCVVTDLLEASISETGMLKRAAHGG